MVIVVLAQTEDDFLAQLTQGLPEDDDEEEAEDECEESEEEKEQKESGESQHGGMTSSTNVTSLRRADVSAVANVLRQQGES